MPNVFRKKNNVHLDEVINICWFSPKKGMGMAFDSGGTLDNFPMFRAPSSQTQWRERG